MFFLRDLNIFSRFILFKSVCACTCVCGYVHLSVGHQIPLEMELQAVLSCPTWVETSNSGPLQGHYASSATELNCLSSSRTQSVSFMLCVIFSDSSSCIDELIL